MFLEKHPWIFEIDDLLSIGFGMPKRQSNEDHLGIIFKVKTGASVLSVKNKLKEKIGSFRTWEEYPIYFEVINEGEMSNDNE